MSSEPEKTWTIAAAIVPGVVGVVDAAGAGLVVQLLDQYHRAERILSPQAGHLRAVMVRVASSGGHADTRSVDAEAPWPHDEIGTAEAAELLGLSTRHTGRLAEAGTFGGSRVIGGRRLVSRAEVVAYVAAHQSST